MNRGSISYENLIVSSSTSGEVLTFFVLIVTSNYIRRNIKPSQGPLDVYRSVCQMMGHL